MTRVFRFATVLMSGVAASVLAAQQAPVRDNTAVRRVTGTAVLSGVVINDKTGQPVRRAVVNASSNETMSRASVVTDETGVFAFNDLPAGRFYLSAGKPGFVMAAYGAKRPNRPGATISLADGDRKTGIELRMMPGAVITGTVRNGNGEPVPGARVAVLRSTFGYDSGERTLAPAGTGGGLGAPTDDRGMYRVYGLPPDDYYVVVTAGIGILRSGSEMTEITAQQMEWAQRQLKAQGTSGTSPTPPPPPGPAVDNAPVFYPGASTQAQASVISVKAGEERTGADITLALIPTAKLTGSVVASDGALPPNVQVNIVAHDTIPGIPFSGFGSARVDKDGKFVSAGLPPGDYTVTARVGGGRGSPVALYGMTTVTINGIDVNTTVRLEDGVTVSGKLVFDSTETKPPADMTRVRVSMTPVRSRTPTLGVPSATADATGAFTFTGVTPGRYRLSAYGAAGTWQLRSVMAQGYDAADVPITIGNDNVAGIEISFTDRPTELSGDLIDAAGRPAPEYFIVVYTADKTFWVPQSRRIQSVRPATDGRFKVSNLPPGDYFIAAVTDVEQGEWYDPSFLASLVSASTKITLAEGEKKVQNLKIGG
jgi:hypothetical protein